MTRLGWAILALIVLGVGGFASMLTVGGGGTATAPGKAVPSPPSGVALVVPVAGVARADLHDNWGEPRGGGTRAHRGLDIAAPAGTPVVAVAPGRIEKLFASELGGTTLYQRSADGTHIYYYAHLAGYAPGAREGLAVRAGQPLAYVGDTGDAGPGNYHLHFGVARTRPGERWWQGEDVNPYPLLAAAPAAR